MMADVHAGHATGIKLFGKTIEVQVRQVKEEEQISKDDDDDQTVEKTRPPDKMIACPRCKSMDTKFFYFNNYNVNQPRHFCKACQRYWTAGGALRNVPVGAGRRRSKPSWDGGGGVLEGCLYDASGVHQFEFDGVVEDWHVAAHGSFRHVFPVKRRRRNTVPSGQNC